MAVDPWTPVDDPADRVRKAIPGARITSERRSAAHNAAVGGSPTSDHVRGFAADFVPPAGMAPAAVEASLRKQGGFDQIIYEGDHVHYSDAPRGRGEVFGMKGAKAPDPWAPVPQDPWTPVQSQPTAPAPTSPDPAIPPGRPQPKAAKPGLASQIGGDLQRASDAAGHYFDEEVHSGVIDPLKKVGSDIAHPYRAPPVHNPWDVVRGMAGGFKRSAQDFGDVASAGMDLAGGALAHAGIVRPLAKAATAIPGTTQAKNEKILGTAMLGLEPELGREAPAAGARAEAPRISPEAPGAPRRPTVPRAVTPTETADAGWTPVRAVPAARAAPGREIGQTGRTANPLAPEGSADHAGPVVGTEADPVERVDNALYRLGGQATADKIEAAQTLKAAPKEIRDPKVQEELTHAVEQRMIDPNAEIPEHLQAAEAVRAPWAERQRVAINRIREKLSARGMTDDEIEEYAPDTGYVPRRVEGKSPTFDAADPERKSPLAVFGKRSLTKTTGSMKARDQIVLEDENGNRVFEHRNPSNDEWKPGMQVRDPLTNKPVTVKQATIREIEGAGARDSKGGLLKYHKNALVNTIDEALRSERVERNLQVLDELTTNLKDEGLAHRTEWRHKNEAGETVVRKANQPTPEGFTELHHIPQLRGWAFDPKVAEVLKDYYPEKGEPIDNVLSVVNRALNASLFITPFPHIKNVGTMGFIGRGWDWIPTVGNYGRLLRTGARATKEVLTLGPRYRKFLREGSGLMAGDDATRNFHQAMLQMAAKGIAEDPKISKAMGLNPIEVGKALYNASHKVLWNVNDMIMLQRQMELEEKGMSSREAIKEAERWIANYRVPPQVFKSRAFQQFITDGKWINFGRYTYGKWRSIGEMAKGLATGSGKDRMDALGKVVAAGFMALVVYPMLDQIAQKATGNKKAKVTRGGELAPIDALTDKEKDWASKMASFVTPAPLIETVPEIMDNRDAFTGRHVIEPGSTPTGQGVQGAEYAADKFYPASLGIESLKPGGAEQAAGRLFGVNLPPSDRDAKRAKGKKYDRRMARSREKKDPLERELKALTR